MLSNYLLGIECDYNDNNSKQNNINGDISLKENKNVINNNEDNQVFTKKKNLLKIYNK